MDNIVFPPSEVYNEVLNSEMELDAISDELSKQCASLVLEEPISYFTTKANVNPSFCSCFFIDFGHINYEFFFRGFFIHYTQMRIIVDCYNFRVFLVQNESNLVVKEMESLIPQITVVFSPIQLWQFVIQRLYLIFIRSLSLFKVSFY